MIFYITNLIKFLLIFVFFFYGSTDLSIILIFGLASLCLLGNLFSLMYCMTLIMFLAQYFTCCRIIYFPLFVLPFLLFTVWVIANIWWSASWSQSFWITRGIWFVTVICWVKSIKSMAADNVLWFWPVVIFYKTTFDSFEWFRKTTSSVFILRVVDFQLKFLW